jgi:hypothetical protein
VSRVRRRGLAGATLIAAVAASAAFAFGLGGERAAGSHRVATCTGAASIDFGCYEQRYRDIVATDGPRAAIADLRERSSQIAYVGAACHQLMHGIGRDAGRRLGIGAFDDGDDTCSSGFFHGVVEAVMARIGAARIERQATSVCAPFRAAGRRDSANYNCVHGMGHGFMEIHGGDVVRSLDGCDALPDRWERHHCVGGVFMQNLTALSHGGSSRNLRPREPLYPCTAVAPRFKHECYMKQTAYALFVRSDDFGAVFRLCASSPDVSFRPDCYQGLGGDAVIHASKYVNGRAAKRSAVRRLCLRGPSPEARRNCVIGAVTVMVRDAAPAVTDAVALCDEFRSGLRRACSGAHLDTVRDLSGSDMSVEAHAPAATLLCRMAARIETRGEVR